MINTCAHCGNRGNEKLKLYRGFAILESCTDCENEIKEFEDKEARAILTSKAKELGMPLHFIETRSSVDLTNLIDYLTNDEGEYLE